MDKVIRDGAVRVGVDLAKRVIQVHAVDGGGRVLTSKAVGRDKFVEVCSAACWMRRCNGSQLQCAPLGA